MRVLLAFLFAATAAFAQPECSASGVVVNSVNGEPLPRATVNMGRALVATTDEIGKWIAGHLSCGKLNLTAARQTFLPGRSMQVELTAGTEAHNIRLELTPQAAITGRIVDQYGDPVANAPVLAKRSQIVDGEREYGPSAGGSTNDIGEYRIAALPAGSYLICTGEQCATPMTIAAGYSGVADFRLGPVTSRHLTGKVSGVPDGIRVQLTLTSDTATLTAPVGPDGEFELSAPPGTYTLLGTAYYGADQLIGRTQLSVADRDIDGLALHLDAGFEIAGTVRIISRQKSPIDASKVGVTLFQIVQGRPNGPRIAWNSDRTSFTATDMMPGLYRLNVSTPPGLHVERVTAGGADITDTETQITSGFPAIEIVLSDGGGTIEGTAAPESGIIVLQGNRHWILRAGKDGHFRSDGFSAGDYRISAWEDLTNVPFRDAAWMELHAKSVTATVNESQSTSVTLERSVAPDE
ncbi:MAG TPA: carboxypeptidase-like regulatory domain-containing protein [Bryobacteraceae bacterium]|nr:carboxypeptidase-like regulatory domain-containing protein [Bryobacteraceae bacterium]